MENKSPYIRMRDVSRVYDALNIGIIITNGEGIITVSYTHLIPVF